MEPEPVVNRDCDAYPGLLMPGASVSHQDSEREDMDAIQGQYAEQEEQGGRRSSERHYKHCETLPVVIRGLWPYRGGVISNPQSLTSVLIATVLTKLGTNDGQIIVLLRN